MATCAHHMIPRVTEPYGWFDCKCGYSFRVVLGKGVVEEKQPAPKQPKEEP